MKRNSIADLKREVQNLVKGSVMVWVDIDNLTHIRIDNDYFTEEVILSTEDIIIYNHDLDQLTQAVLKQYKKKLEKRFLKMR